MDMNGGIPLMGPLNPQLLFQNVQPNDIKLPVNDPMRPAQDPNLKPLRSSNSRPRRSSISLQSSAMAMQIKLEEATKEIERLRFEKVATDQMNFDRMIGMQLALNTAQNETRTVQQFHHMLISKLERYESRLKDAHVVINNYSAKIRELGEEVTDLKVQVASHGGQVKAKENTSPKKSEE